MAKPLRAGAVRNAVTRGTEADAIANHYQKNFDRLVRTLFLVSGSWDLAQDAASEAYARLLVRRSPWHLKNTDAWLFVVGRNVLRRAQRRSQREDHSLEGLIPSTSPMECVLERIDIVRFLRRCTCRERQIAVMFYVLDLKQVDIAARLHVRRSTVAAILHELRRRAQLEGTE